MLIATMHRLLLYQQNKTKKKVLKEIGLKAEGSTLCLKSAYDKRENIYV